MNIPRRGGSGKSAQRSSTSLCVAQSVPDQVHGGRCEVTHFTCTHTKARSFVFSNTLLGWEFRLTSCQCHKCGHRTLVSRVPATYLGRFSTARSRCDKDPEPRFPVTIPVIFVIVKHGVCSLKSTMGGTDARQSMRAVQHLFRERAATHVTGSSIAGMHAHVCTAAAEV